MLTTVPFWSSNSKHCTLYWCFKWTLFDVIICCLIVFHVTFYTIRVISWRSVWLTRETGVPGGNRRPAVPVLLKYCHTTEVISILVHLFKCSILCLTTPLRHLVSARNDERMNSDFFVKSKNIKAQLMCKFAQLYACHELFRF
jgi:hypothetical protein